MLEKKECFMEKLFLATLWASLLIITVNFGNRTKVFKFWVDLKHKHLALHVHNSLKAEKKPKEASKWPQSIIQ